MHFAEMVSLRRAAKFTTSKDFHREANLSCSYYHYSKIESGTVPDIELAVEIIRALDIPLKKGLYAYLHTTLVDKEARSLFQDLDDENTPELAGTVSINKSVILNHAQGDFLLKNPANLEATLLLALNARYRSFSANEVADEMNLSAEHTKEMLQSLSDLGLLTKSVNGQYTTKDWIYTPPDSEFAALKDATLKRALEKFLEQPADDRWQRSITKFLTPRQRDYVNQLLENLCSTIVALPEPPRGKGKPYTLGLFSSWRKFGRA